MTDTATMTQKTKPKKKENMLLLQQVMNVATATLAGETTTPPAESAKAEQPVDTPKPDQTTALGFTEQEYPPMDELISEILTTRRAHNSPGEIDFLKWLHAHIAKLGLKAVTLEMGATSVEVGVGSKTMFSCHIDTMHSYHESNGQRQKIAYDANFGHIFIDGKDSGCLGADDGAGIYIMLKMMEAKVPGVYVFHRGEEVGCLSSWAILKAQAEWLKTFNACIAFDRPCADEVIITQSGQECASPEYGGALAKALNALCPDFSYAISTKGVVTDSKVYRTVIPECINIGVGYSSQHTSGETQDWDHLVKLTKAAIKLDWDGLKPVRVPKPAEVPQNGARFSQGSVGSGYYSGAASQGGNVFGMQPKPKKSKQPVSDYKGSYKGKSYDPQTNPFDIDFQTMTMSEIEELVVDTGVAQGISRLLCDLDAEQARVKRLHKLLGF